MTQITTLSSFALPGQSYSFAAKTEVVSSRLFDVATRDRLFDVASRTGLFDVTGEDNTFDAETDI